MICVLTKLSENQDKAERYANVVNGFRIVSKLYGSDFDMPQSTNIISPSCDKPLSSTEHGGELVRPVVLERATMSGFERISSLLIAMAMLTGILVSFLFLVWLTSGDRERDNRLKEPIELQVTGGPAVESFDAELTTPGFEEISDLIDPAVENSLRAMDDAIDTVPASWHSIESNSAMTTNAVFGRSGQSIARPPGPLSAEDIVPRFERWKLRFVAKDIEYYAKQLDFHGIELGAIGGSVPGVDYASELATSPAARWGDSKSEDRLYFIWTRPGPLMDFDRQLLKRANVELKDRTKLKFLPKNLENKLAWMELENAKSQGKSNVAVIAETIFESRSVEDGFEFMVVEQIYRRSRTN